MPKNPLIGIAGPARSGKDTIANFIVATAGGYRYSFADPIRQMLRPLGIDMSDPYWVDHKEQVIPALGVSPRRLMQTLGTDWGRELVHPDIWLTMALQRLVHVGPGMVIADVRFENEAAWVRKYGGRILHVHRPDAAAIEAHASEYGIQQLPEDLMIMNAGSLEDLHAKVKDMFNASYFS